MDILRLNPFACNEHRRVLICPTKQLNDGEACEAHISVGFVMGQQQVLSAVCKTAIRDIQWQRDPTLFERIVKNRWTQSKNLWHIKSSAYFSSLTDSIEQTSVSRQRIHHAGHDESFSFNSNPKSKCRCMQQTRPFAQPTQETIFLYCERFAIISLYLRLKLSDCINHTLNAIHSGFW